MKKKFHKESDYPVIGFTQESKGQYKGAIIWICETVTPSGLKKPFRVVPDGTKRERITAFEEVSKNPTEYIGRRLQVRYYDLTADAVPKFANSALYPKLR